VPQAETKDTQLFFSFWLFSFYNAVSVRKIWNLQIFLTFFQ